MKKRKSKLIEAFIDDVADVSDLSDLEISENDYYAGILDIQNGVLVKCLDHNISEIKIPNSVTSIGNYAFCMCNSLTSIAIPDSVIGIGSYAFAYCRNLTDVTIPNGVTSIGDNAFIACDQLQNIKLSENLKTIGDHAFSYCEKLKNIELPDNVRSIHDAAFEFCRTLEHITLPPKLKTLARFLLYSCSSLKSIKIPRTVLTINDGAIYKCDKLTDIYYEGTEDEWNKISIKKHSKDIERATIHYNSAMNESIDDISDVLDIDVSENDYYAGLLDIQNNDVLVSCLEPSIIEISIPNGVKYIGDWAFTDCSNLTSITIPNSVTGIGFAAFSGCISLKDVYYQGTKEQWNEIEIFTPYSGNLNLFNANIHYNSPVKENLEENKKKKRKSKLCSIKLDAGNVEYNTTFFNAAMNAPSASPTAAESLQEKVETPDIEKINKFIEDIYQLRKDSIRTEGEYSTGNLIFKEFRNLEYLDKLKDIKNKLISKELSLESIQEKGEVNMNEKKELTETLDSWYQNRNKSWSNFYRQKAGLGADDPIDVDNLDPWAVSVTCCYKNCPPELLKEVLKQY